MGRAGEALGAVLHQTYNMPLGHARGLSAGRTNSTLMVVDPSPGSGRPLTGSEPPTLPTH